MSKRFIITEEEKDNIKKLYDISEQSSDIDKSAGFLASLLLKPDISKNSLTSNTKTSDDDFYKSILKCLGAEPTNNNMMFMYAWRQAEGGGAKNNPFNTTLDWDGATKVVGSSAGVKNYRTSEDGIQATCTTLKNGGSKYGYDKIIEGLRNDIGITKLCDTVISSNWGTKDLLRKVSQGYIAGNSPKPHPINKTDMV